MDDSEEIKMEEESSNVRVIDDDDDDDRLSSHKGRHGMGAASNGTLPWVEKYRPKRLDEISHQQDVVNALRRAISSGNFPHLLFYGPPGTGKTSTILAVCRELFGSEFLSSRVLELNASNERGIDVIRHKVKEFASTAVGRGGEHSSLPPFKIIILDEADSMTKDAQSALRRTMEQYSKVTRFCIICNYISRMIDPITSRCAKFRFQPLAVEAMKGRLKMIAESEGLIFDKAEIDDGKNHFERIIDISEGDMRKAITILQSVHRIYGSSSKFSSSPSIRLIDIETVAGAIPQSVIDSLLNATKKNQFRYVSEAAQESILNAYPVDALIASLQNTLLHNSDMNDLPKARVLMHLAETEKRLLDGADELIQLIDVLAIIAQAWQQTS